MQKKDSKWIQDVRAIHSRISSQQGVGSRIQKIADAWKNRPYVANSLIGGPDSPERLVVNLRAFDCVTFIESALALARSHSVRGFVRELKSIRYRRGKIDWFSRLHYFSDWLKSNHASGAVQIRTRGLGSRPISTSLAFVEGLPVRSTNFHVVPKRKIHLAHQRIENGSVVAFASVRSRLDFFHTGLLFCQKQQITLVHASRSATKVMAEPLKEFLDRNRMRGIAFAAPRDPGEKR